MDWFFSTFQAGSDKGSSPFRSMFVGVDIFVFLSGLLTAYYATQKLAKGGKLNLMQMYFSRYIKCVQQLQFSQFPFKDIFMK